MRARLLPFILILSACQVIGHTSSNQVAEEEHGTESMIHHHVPKEISSTLQLGLSSSQESIVPTLECKDIHLKPAALRCDHVREACNTEEYNVGLLNYLSLYYCYLPGTLVMFIAILALTVSFASLGITAADYLSPNLYTISKLLQLSDHLAGLTLLAIGNSAADIFGTYTALSIGSAELAISELLGATLFVLTVVIGSICLVSPFKVPVFHYTRDNLFYIAVLAVIEYALEKNELDVTKASILIGIYAIYVLVAVLNHSWLKVANRKRITTERIRSTFNIPASDIQGETDEITSAGLLLPGIESLEDMSDEERQMLEEVEDYFATHPEEELDVLVPVQTGSYGLKILLKELSMHTTNLPNRGPNSMNLDEEGRILEEPFQGAQNQSTYEAALDEEADLDDANQQYHWKPRRIKKKLLMEVIHSLVPRWNHDDTMISKIFFIITYPAKIVLSFTTPVREKAIVYARNTIRGSNAFTLPTTNRDLQTSLGELYDIRLDLIAFKIQFAFGITTLSVMHLKPLFIILLVPPIFLGASTIAFLFLPTRCPQFEHQMTVFKAWNYTGSILGFVLSIHWISVFATEVIAILKQVALILGISDEILGVTVFAMGNSVGDLISNLTIALMGMPLMAFAACFGGPLLSLCSMGFNSLLVMSNSDLTTIGIYHSTTLRLNVVVIFCVLVFMNLYFSVVSHHQVDRTLGFILILVWILTVSVCAFIELR